MIKHEPDYNCSKCGTQVKLEHDGADVIVHPCEVCKDDNFDRGWNASLDHNQPDAGINAIDILSYIVVVFICMVCGWIVWEVVWTIFFN